MQVVFSLAELETLLSEETQRRVGAGDIDGCSFKTSMQVVYRAVEDHPAGQVAPVIVIDVALPEDVAANVVTRPSKDARGDAQPRAP
jgi:hypothetical protein